MSNREIIQIIEQNGLFHVVNFYEKTTGSIFGDDQMDTGVSVRWNGVQAYVIVQPCPSGLLALSYAHAVEVAGAIAQRG